MSMIYLALEESIRVNCAVAEPAQFLTRSLIGVSGLLLIILDGGRFLVNNFFGGVGSPDLTPFVVARVTACHDRHWPLQSW